jgi:hypothetical protein
MNRLLAVFNLAAGAPFDDIYIYALDNPQEGYTFHKKIVDYFATGAAAYKFGFIVKILKGNLPCRKLDVKESYRTDFMDIYEWMEKD